MGTEETSRPTSAASKATNIGEIEDEEEEVGMVSRVIGIKNHTN